MHSIGLECLIWGGASAVLRLRLIDCGAYVTWTETSGLEMVADFNREVGQEVVQQNRLFTQKAFVVF